MRTQDAIEIDESMLGSNWTNADDIHLFAQCLSEVTGFDVSVSDAYNGAPISDVSESDWNEALDTYTDRWTPRPAAILSDWRQAWADGAWDGDETPDDILCEFTNNEQSSIDRDGDVWTGNSWIDDDEKAVLIQWLKDHKHI